MAEHEHHAPDERATAHIVEPRTYLGIIAILMVLLIITLIAAMFDLGNLNLPIAMVIAVVKVYFVMAFFMHLKFNSKLVRFFALGALAFLFVMFLITPSDYITRSWMPVR
jgi:cytochrome c oxidase subunit IV